MNYESEGRRPKAEGCEARSNLNYELLKQSLLDARNKELFFESFTFKKAMLVSSIFFVIFSPS